MLSVTGKFVLAQVAVSCVADENEAAVVDFGGKRNEGSALALFYKITHAAEDHHGLIGGHVPQIGAHL